MDWTVNDLKQKLETDISDENARKSILKIFANIIEKTHHLNPSNWNISFRKGGTGIRFQLNFGHRYVLGVYADSILVMNKRETFLNFPKDFISEILNECDFVNDGTNKTPKPTTVEELENYPPEELWNNSIQFKIPFSKCEKYLETLEPAICDFAKWCTENRKINPQSEDAHVSTFIDYLNQELETSIPQPEYDKNNNIIFSTKQKKAILELAKNYEKLLETNPNLAFFDEEYKWKTITDCTNKSNIEIFDYLINSKSNLFDTVSVGQATNDLADNTLKNELLEKLYDETISLDERLLEFKTIIKNKSNKEKNRIISDERSASVFLTCKNPQKYSFYKASYYVELCKYLGIPDSIFGKRYSHYLELISEITKIILENTNLKEKIEPLTNHYIKSKNLIIQNMLYVLFDKMHFSANKGDTQMTDYEKKLDEIKNNLSVNRNVILTGAPGTGKTFMAKTVAARIILEREINDFDKDLTEEEKKQVESQTDFVQFHPSYDYTDFVEGLRPKQVDGSDQIGFERKDGVFKAFCEKALKESYRENNDNVDNFEECWKKLVDELNENDFVTIPLISGKGDFRVELNEYGTGLANRTYENDDYQKGKWIQGKSKFFSKDQLYNIYQGLPGTPAGGHDNYRKAVVEYMKKNLGLLDYKKTESTQKAKKNFVFIIDEINRGEVAKIFGELFYCIDPGYRGEKGRISTQYQNLVTSGEFQKGFFIPENVYIIGTMNDIDRSVESMDFAFRRRFSWIEVKASDTVDMLDPKHDDNGELISGLETDLAEEAKLRMKNLNAAISKIDELNDAYHIGASYFLKLKNYDGDFDKLWDYHIKGILTEYLRGNPNAQEELTKLKAAYDKAEELKAGE